MEGASDFGEVPDEPLVEVHKSYEGLDVLYFCQLWPVCDSLDFNGVHLYMVFGDDEPKVVHLSMFEFAFLWSEEQLVGMEGLEYLSSDPLVVCEGGRVDEDVIHVANGFIAIDKGAEDVIHHHLEGGQQVAQSVRACLRPGMYHILVLTELRQICRTGAQGDGSLLNALSRKCYMHTLQYVHRGTLP